MPSHDQEELDYRNKLILAPMVRIGTLPTRLLALEFGADIAYSDELIDYRLLKCQRIENKVLGTIDYVDDDQNVVYRTCEKEKGKNVIQIGTCCPERAVKVAKFMEQDVAGIDVNMGCPKEFSIKGGMGAALLSQPEKVKAILTSLVQAVKCPVTCKIRVLKSIEDTIAFCKIIESTGVKAIAVHGRKIEERPQHANRNFVIRALSEALSVPIIANGGSGEIAKYEDIERFRCNTGAASVMIARQAESNCSIFRKEGKVTLDELVIKYLNYAIEYDNQATNTKYCVQQMLGSLQESERGKALLASQQMEEICILWGLDGVYKARQEHLWNKVAKLKELSNALKVLNPWKKRRIGTDEIWEMEARFIRNMFDMDNLPKTVLINWARKNNLPNPLYKTEPTEKSFRSVVLVDGKKYSSTYQERNKKNAEQSAALIALYALGLIDESKIKGNTAGCPL